MKPVSYIIQNRFSSLHFIRYYIHFGIHASDRLSKKKKKSIMDGFSKKKIANVFSELFLTSVADPTRRVPQAIL